MSNRAKLNKVIRQSEVIEDADYASQIKKELSDVIRNHPRDAAAIHSVIKKLNIDPTKVRSSTLTSHMRDLGYNIPFERTRNRLTSRLGNVVKAVTNIPEELPKPDITDIPEQKQEQKQPAEQPTEQKQSFADFYKEVKQEYEVAQEVESWGEEPRTLQEIDFGSPIDEDIKSDEYITRGIEPETKSPEQLSDEPDVATVPTDLQRVDIPAAYTELSHTEGHEFDEKHFETDEFKIKLEPATDVIPENPALAGGSGDLIREPDADYLDVLEDGKDDISLISTGEAFPFSLEDLGYTAERGREIYESLEDVLSRSGLPRPERKFESSVAQDEPGVQNWDGYLEGSAGDAPEDIGHADYVRSTIFGDDEGKYAQVVDLGEIEDDWKEMLQSGLDKPPEIAAIQKARRARAAGDTSAAPRLSESTDPYRTSTRAIRKDTKEAPTKRGSRYTNVGLVRESRLNHLRSISELMPNI